MATALRRAIYAVLPVALSGQTTVGPASMMPWDPRNVPGPGWPGIDAAASSAAWPTGQQLPSLRAWSTEDDEPLPCWSTQVLRDTATGWPGQCRDLAPVPAYTDEESCKASCVNNPTCAVWQFLATGECFQGDGLQCDTPAAGTAPVAIHRAQRIQHGDVRVLKNMKGWEVLNLRPLGYWETGNATEAAERCRAFCYSKVLCQYWQYGTGGCFVEDPKNLLMGLVHKYSAQYPLTTTGGATTTSAFAQTSVGGEYIQHLCPARPTTATTTVAPSETEVMMAYWERPANYIPLLILIGLILLTLLGLCCYLCGCCTPARDPVKLPAHPSKYRGARVNEESPMLSMRLDEMSETSSHLAGDSFISVSSPLKLNGESFPASQAVEGSLVPQMRSPFQPSGGYQPVSTTAPIPVPQPQSNGGSTVSSFVAAPTSTSHALSSSSSVPVVQYQQPAGARPQQAPQMVLQQRPAAAYGQPVAAPGAVVRYS